MYTQIIGSWGERAAARVFEARGYRIVARNVRTRFGELDLLCARGRELLVVEVKTRTSDRFGYPEEAVTWQKQKRMRKVFSEAVRTGLIRPRRSVRFCVCAILAQKETIRVKIIYCE